MVPGRYTPIRRLGTGGMGDVFLSREQAADGLGRRVALKRIRPELARDEHFRDMFRREAQLALGMSHPNIVHVYEVGGEEDLYLAMEYVEGRTLHELLAQAGRLDLVVPMEVTLAIALDVARGLHYAHELHGEDGQPLEIVHRDLSPRNVVVSLDGTARILDFGVAKAAVLQQDDGVIELQGNPSYMSPEQARLELVDRRSDVFTLGILLWELTTGRRLFQIENPLHAVEVIGRVRVPSPSEYRPVPPGWEGVLRRALAPDREDRYPTARALQLDVEDVARSAGTLVSNLPVVATLAALFPEVALELEPQPELREQRPSVLVVDDEENMRELITRALRRSFELVTAGSVPEALAALAARPFDAVLSDERMPDGRGIDLLSHVARHSPRTVRVMVTAHAETDLMMHAINDGRVHRFVVKPFRPLDLLTLLEQALADRPALADGAGERPAEITARKPRFARHELDEDAGAVTEVSRSRPLPAPLGTGLPWESLRHLAAPAREGALSAQLVVGAADRPLGEEARALVEWVVGSRLGSFWCHVEDRALALVVPGLAPSGLEQLLAELRAALTESLAVRAAFAADELADGADLVAVGRRVEEAALDAWRRAEAP